jgi:hypothetical protein
MFDAGAFDDISNKIINVIVNKLLCLICNDHSDFSLKDDTEIVPLNLFDVGCDTAQQYFEQNIVVRNIKIKHDYLINGVFDEYICYNFKLKSDDDAMTPDDAMVPDDVVDDTDDYAMKID